jgi:hypothetical protein
MGQLFADAEPAIALESADLLDDTAQYRRTSPFAIACALFGLISLVGLATVQDIGFLPYLTIPAFGLVLGMRARSSIVNRGEGGKTMNTVGLALCAVGLVAAWPLQKFLDANEVPPGYQRIGYEVLQAEEGKGPIPDSAKALDGKRVFIKGFVYPGKQTRGVKEFVLCRDNGSCCFGGQPKLNDMIQVKLQGDLALDYDTTQRHLAGTFRVSETSGSEGLGMVLYQLDADYLQ